MPHPALIRALVATACALPILAAASCKEEPTNLFDEDGAWKLLYFKLEDGDDIGGFGSALREGNFMIYLDQKAKVVATAACNDSMGNQGVTSSQCDVPKELGGYYCRCFNYEYDVDFMTWTEFVPEGQPAPPEPTEDDIQNGVQKPSAGVRIKLAEYDPDNFNETYRFQPLPWRVFDSNGVSSEYVFQAINPMLFDEKSGCREICGIGAEAPME